MNETRRIWMHDGHRRLARATVEIEHGDTYIRATFRRPRDGWRHSDAALLRDGHWISDRGIAFSREDAIADLQRVAEGHWEQQRVVYI